MISLNKALTAGARRAKSPAGFHKTVRVNRRLTFNALLVKRPDNSGFTMVEVVVMIAIIGVISTMAITALVGAFNNTTEQDQRARSMYYSAQSMMTGIKLSATLPKNSDGSIKLYKNGFNDGDDSNDADIFPVGTKNYYFEIYAEGGEIQNFRFMICEPGGISAALAHDDDDNDYGDSTGAYYVQYSEIDNDDNDAAWSTLKARFAPYVTDPELAGYFIIIVDSKYRVDRVYFSPQPYSSIESESFSGDGYIDDVGKIGAFPTLASRQGRTVMQGLSV